MHSTPQIGSRPGYILPSLLRLVPCRDWYPDSLLGYPDSLPGYPAGTELSAAAALDVLYTYALAHQPDFDVRWCKGSVSERIFAPWVAEIERMGGR
eukprot:919136-Prorocentrum_minimum.AAC.1